MKTGDSVVVTNLDGERAEGEIVDILAETVEEYEFTLKGGKTVSLEEYWRGKDVDPTAPVVRVRLEGDIYAYPADRVEVTE